MPDEKTHADSARLYLTGAASDGAAQADPNASLGLYRSSSEVDHLGVQVTNPISNVTVDFVAGANATGNGSLSAESIDDLAWTPPGGTKGTAVTIANGETKILEGGGGATEKYVRVTRTTADNLAGTATLTLVEVMNNALGFDNVSSSEASAGDTEYRCVSVKNEASSEIKGLKVWLSRLGTARAVDASGYAAAGAVTVTAKTNDFSDWPSSGFTENENTGEVLYYSSRTSTALTVPAGGRDIWTDVAGGAAGSEDDVIVPIPGVRIAKEAPSSQPTGSFTDKTGAGEGSQPAGLTWVHPHQESDADVVTVGDLTAGYIYALWLERKVPVGRVAETTVDQRLEWTFDAV